MTDEGNDAILCESMRACFDGDAALLHECNIYKTRFVVLCVLQQIHGTYASISSCIAQRISSIGSRQAQSMTHIPLTTSSDQRLSPSTPSDLIRAAVWLRCARRCVESVQQPCPFAPSALPRPYGRGEGVEGLHL